MAARPLTADEEETRGEESTEFDFVPKGLYEAGSKLLIQGFIGSFSKGY